MDLNGNGAVLVETKKDPFINCSGNVERRRREKTERARYREYSPLDRKDRRLWVEFVLLLLFFFFFSVAQKLMR